MALPKIMSKSVQRLEDNSSPLWDLLNMYESTTQDQQAWRTRSRTLRDYWVRIRVAKCASEGGGHDPLFLRSQTAHVLFYQPNFGSASIRVLKHFSFLMGNDSQCSL